MANWEREPGWGPSPGDSAPPPPAAAAPISPSAPIINVHSPLARLRARARALLVSQRLLLVIAALVAAAGAMGLIDYLLRLPWSLRAANLGIACVAVLLALIKFVRPAFLFRPTLTDVAIRVERAHPEVSGSLASALEFEAASREGKVTSPMSAALAQESVRNFAGRWKASDLGDMLNGRRMLRSLALLGLGAVIAGAPFFVNAPLWRIGAKRQLAPWTGAKWPSRTTVMDVTGINVHPLGRALPLRAAVTKSDSPMDKTDVVVRYRLIAADGTSEPRRELLTWQERDAFADEPDAGVRGELFERLLEPEATAIEYRFETGDDLTAWRRIELVEPPIVLSAEAVVTPPAYAAALSSSTDAPASTHIDLGPGTDDRAAAPPALAGSRVELTIKLNKASAFVGDALAAITAIDPNAVIEPDTQNQTDTVKARFVLSDSLRLALRLVDEYAIESVDEAIYRFEATPDRAPAASITSPSTDRGVLATAKIEIVGEGRDDVGLAYTAIEQRLAQPAGRPGGEPSGPGGAMEEGAPIEIARTQAKGNTTAESRVSLELTPLGLKPGDEVRLFALAADVLGASIEGREPTRSGVRTLRIISESEFVDEIRGQLGEVRQAAQRIEAQQTELQARATERGADIPARRGQAQVTDRVARQGETLERIGERIKENALADQGLADLLGEVGTRLNEAGKASGKAASSLDEAAARRPPDAEEAAEKLSPDEAAAVGQSQEQVRRELSNVIELLDRGEDSWVVRNTVERLLREQKSVAGETGSAAQRTAGREASDLSPAEKAEQARIVEKQSQLAEQTRKLVEQMKEREKAMRESDPTAAAGMAEAARRAEQSQVAQTMQQAAQQASQNQMTSAGQSQQQAAKALEQMLQDLDAGEKSRDAVLRRTLRSIIESLTKLVGDQEREIASIADAEQRDGDFAGLDQAMIALNTNTLGVVETARKSGPTLAPLVPIIARAAEAQGAAIKGLRATTVDPVLVREKESVSLDALKDALEKAKKLDEDAEQREQQKKSGELQRAYRETLEKQLALRSDTAPFADIKELGRRDRVMVRKLSERQVVIRDTLTALLKETKELQEAKVFEFAHKRLDTLTSHAAGALEQADARLALTQEDAAIVTLKGLIEAMGDAKKKNPFSENQQASGGGQGQSGQKPKLIPPAKELRLLRSLQADVADQTTAIENTPGKTPKAVIDEIAAQQRSLAGIAEDLVKRVQSGGAPEKTFPGLAPDEEGNADEQPANDQEPAPAGPPATPSFGVPFVVVFADESAPKPAEEKKQEAAPAKDAEELPSLDKLLDLPESKPVERDTPDAAAPKGADSDPAKAALDRKLSAEETQEKFIEAVRQMGEIADRLEKVRDTGLATQRIQQDILRKLDMLIESSEQQESKSSSKSSSSDQQQSGKPSPQNSQQQPQNQETKSEPQAAAAGAGNPAFKQGQREQLNAVRAAWGGLPSRVRDTFLEGMDEYYSKLYESMTESYYRKAAESASEK